MLRGNIAVWHVRCTEEVILFYLEVRVDALESLCIVGELTADVLAVSEDAVEVGPGSLDRHP